MATILIDPDFFSNANRTLTSTENVNAVNPLLISLDVLIPDHSEQQ